MDSLKTLSLCTGIGGLDLGVAAAIPIGLRVTCVVEREAFALAHMVTSCRARGVVAPPIYTNLELFDGLPWRGRIDCILGGYPCQPFSLAGKQRGHDDSRHLWPHIARIVAEVQAPLLFFENVPGHIKKGLDEVIGDLEGLGYSVRAGRLRAEDVGAPHRRERVFILAHTDSEGLEGCCASGEAYETREAQTTERREPSGLHTEVPYTDSGGCETLRSQRVLNSVGETHGDNIDGCCEPWSIEPSVGRVADGVPDRVDRLRALGNSVVPLQAAVAFQQLTRIALEGSL